VPKVKFGSGQWAATAEVLLEIVAVAGAWTALFWFNAWFFESFSASQYVSWIFLPAAIRILSVLVLDWRGVVGLFVGAMLTNLPDMGTHALRCVLLSLLSATAPYIAVRLAKSSLRMNKTLDSLSSQQLMATAGIGALCSALLHSVFFTLTDATATWHQTFFQMSVGDLIGTAAVLYAASAILKAIHPPH
jgi:hypothetical protein